MTPDILEHLQAIMQDPMWDAHVEVSKGTIHRAIDEIIWLRLQVQALQQLRKESK